jgi:hypothetical protein
MATVLALFISNRSRRVRRETGIFLSESQNQKTWMQTRVQMACFGLCQVLDSGDAGSRP